MLTPACRRSRQECRQLAVLRKKQTFDNAWVSLTSVKNLRADKLARCYASEPVFRFVFLNPMHSCQSEYSLPLAGGFCFLDVVNKEPTTHAGRIA